MYFIDELDNLKLYRRSFLLPINDKDKRHGKAAILLGPTKDSLTSLGQNHFFRNRYYNAYYLERALMYFISGNEVESSDMNAVEESVIIEGEVQLFPSSIVNYHGYDVYVKDVAGILNQDWFKSVFKKYKINRSNIPSIDINIEDGFKLSTKDSINVVSKRAFNSAFKSYKTYCEFAAYNWLAYQMNPSINDTLAVAFALKECKIAEMYDMDKWPFHANMGILVRSLYLYEQEHGFDKYLYDIIRSNGGEHKLSYRLYDMINMLRDDLKKALGENAISTEDSICLGEAYILLNEATSDSVMKRLLFDHRIKSIKELKGIYADIKEKHPSIKYTYNELSIYNKLNLLVDYGMYNEAFIMNSQFKNIKGYNVYCDLLKRLLSNPKLEAEGYSVDTVIIPVPEWYYFSKCNYILDFWNIAKSINPFSCIYKMMVSEPHKLTEIFGDKNILFLSENGFMKVNFSTFNANDKRLFYRNINSLVNRKEAISDPDAVRGLSATASPKAIKVDIIDKVEKSKGVEINDITPSEKKTNTDKNTTEKDKQKQEIVDIVDKASQNKTNVDTALDSIDNDEAEQARLQKLLTDIAANSDKGSNISGARASRMLKLQNDFLDSEMNGKKIKDIIEPTTQSAPPIKPVKLSIDSVNPEWENLTFASTLDSYKLDDDIVRIFSSFYNVTNPIVVKDLKAEDTSTSEDLILTYTCNMESAKGERFTIKVDIPKFIDGKYMKLRGNRKNIPIQMFLMPIIKTDEDAVQVISCYKKIFIRRFGTTSGKSNIYSDKLYKTLTKSEYKNIKIVVGDNSKVCSKYEVPIDYIDLSGEFSIIETPVTKYIFNQDVIRETVKVDDKEGLCVGYKKKDKSPVYYKPDPNHPSFFSYWLASKIWEEADNDEFFEAFKKSSTSVRHCYSRASILDTQIPLIVVCAYSEGLESVLQKGNIKYKLSEKKAELELGGFVDYIRFSDGYLTYENNYASSLLMNGLKACDTENYSLSEINSKSMYLNFLDSFGGRIKADGLDNFYDCMIDPITKETLEYYKLPTDYISVLLHANLLLSDNKFVKHGDIRASRRFRKAEQVAHYLYMELARAYGAYSTGITHGKKVGFSIKQSAVIDAVLLNNTTEDLSILNPLGEYEAYYTVTPKGPTGMNSERSYSLDKRSYDESMVNILSTSTGFAGNVGINRQATIDANIYTSRGYVHNDPSTDPNKEINPVKTLCMTEALTPFGTTRDDPMRQAMGFIQKSKHSMRCEKGDPLLISNGADEALPYLVSNTFAFKAKGKGKVVEIVPDKYMIIEYDEPQRDPNTGEKIKTEYVKLVTEVQKNSSAGFFVPLKLSTNLKVDQKFKANDIIAYDKLAFSSEVGPYDNIAYNVGTLAKFAILNTDEGFEDSAIISEDLSDAMTSDIIKEKVITISKDSEVYNLIKKGQKVREGDTLMIVQNAYDEADTNALIKKLGGDESDITELGRKTYTSSVTGEIQDIIITRTVEDSELSSTLKKIVAEYEKDIKQQKAIMKKYGINDSNHDLPDLGKLPATGKLKNAADSVVIRIYLKYRDRFAVGDKMIYGTAVKGVLKDLFPEGQEPYSEYRKDEKIHSLLSIGSINARMVTSVLVSAGINKALIELSRKCKKIAGIDDDINLI